MQVLICLQLKNMAGLLKPNAAEILIPALRESVQIPIALHTRYSRNSDCDLFKSDRICGIDSIDCALASFSGITSQPNLN